jgi:ubiquinone/menaquinone biosynthesis C-methylase UbiE
MTKQNGYIMVRSNDSKKEAVEKFFTSTSESYSELFLAKRRGKNFEFRQRLEIANEITDAIGGSLLDCATGSGEITASILKKGRFGQVTVVDLSPNMLGFAQRQIETAVRDQRPMELEFVNADIFRFAAENAYRRFNLILCLGLIAHTGRLIELLTALKRMLHPEGAILLQATRSDHLGVRIHYGLTARRYMRRHGYRISRFRQRDIIDGARDAGLAVAAQRRYAIAIPFGDRIWARANFYLERTFQGWASSHGAEELYVLKPKNGSP